MKLKHTFAVLALGLGAIGSGHAGLANPAPAIQQADPVWREAQIACAALPVERELACLHAAYAAHVLRHTEFAEGTPPVTPGGLPAVQTQSPAVTSTGIAPPAVDHRAPGTPAFPKR